ncbi:MAG TPA: glycosyl hydrolase 115 family protein [Terriglobia bacterium]|nr:glycosyl hydrolase 115 family protein [Terriglobia bacterium]
MKSWITFVASCIAFFPVSALGSLNLDSRTTLYISPAAPAPIQAAARDLARDWSKVFGNPIRVVGNPKDAGPLTLWIALDHDLPDTVKRPSGWEQLHIQAIDQPSPGSPARHAVVLTGSDMRGTIYAIYQFSQEFLGVDPFYWWTDHTPPRRTHISVPDNFSETQGPTFHYRGFFINDEDLLTGWAPPRKKEGTGISLEVWNKIFETILRLKGNMVAPGTWIFPDEPQIKLAGERGLILTQHHAIPLGLNVARWPEGVPYSYTSHPEILEQAWKDAAAAYPRDQEVLWTVGLRGLSDVSYAAFDPSVRDNDEALGHLIGKAIADQMGIVRSLRPDAQFITSLWQEGARLVQKGYLKIPPEVHVVWADDGYGNLQDKGEVAAGQGAYDHVAMMNARANQLTEMVPVERIDSELGRYIKAGATHYLLLNTSDIRPVSMTTKAVMDIAWKGLPHAATGESDKFYHQWSSQEFGEKAASQVAEIYKDYFNAPAHFSFGPGPSHEYGDNYYHTQARLLLLSHMIDSPLYSIPSQAPKWVMPRIFGLRGGTGKAWLPAAVKAEIQRCGEAQPRWDALWKRALDAEPLVAPDRRPFYRAHVLAMIAINRESNRILSLVGEAIQDDDAGDKAKARDAGERALRAFDEIQRAETEAEYGKWKNWYRGDWLTGIPRTRELVQIFLKQLEDPLSPLPPPILWSGWEAYYHIMHYEGDRSADVK